MRPRSKRGIFAAALMLFGIASAHFVRIETGVQVRWDAEEQKLDAFHSVSGELVQVMKGQSFGERSNNLATFRLMRPGFCYVNTRFNVDPRSRGYIVATELTPGNGSTIAWWPDGSHERVISDNAQLSATLDPFGELIASGQGFQPVRCFPIEFFGQQAEAFEVQAALSIGLEVRELLKGDAETQPFRELLYFRASDGMPLGATFWQAGTGERVETDVYRNLVTNPSLSEADFPTGA